MFATYSLIFFAFRTRFRSLHTQMVLDVSLPQWVVECYIPRWYLTSPDPSSAASSFESNWHRSCSSGLRQTFAKTFRRPLKTLQPITKRRKHHVQGQSLQLYFVGVKGNLNSTRGSHLPVGHSNNVAVHPVNTGLVYHPLHRRDEHFAPLQTETLLGRKLLGEKLLESGDKPSALSNPHELRSKASQKMCACVFINVKILQTERLQCYILRKYSREIKRTALHGNGFQPLEPWGTGSEHCTLRRCVRLCKNDGDVNITGSLNARLPNVMTSHHVIIVKCWRLLRQVLTNVSQLNIFLGSHRTRMLPNIPCFVFFVAYLLWIFAFELDFFWCEPTHTW